MSININGSKQSEEHDNMEIMEEDNGIDKVYTGENNIKELFCHQNHFMAKEKDIFLNDIRLRHSGKKFTYVEFETIINDLNTKWIDYLKQEHLKYEQQLLSLVEEVEKKETLRNQATINNIHRMHEEEVEAVKQEVLEQSHKIILEEMRVNAEREQKSKNELNIELVRALEESKRLMRKEFDIKITRVKNAHKVEVARYFAQKLQGVMNEFENFKMRIVDMTWDIQKLEIKSISDLESIENLAREQKITIERMKNEFETKLESHFTMNLKKNRCLKNTDDINFPINKVDAGKEIRIVGNKHTYIANRNLETLEGGNELKTITCDKNPYKHSVTFDNKDLNLKIGLGNTVITELDQLKLDALTPLIINSRKMDTCFTDENPNIVVELKSHRSSRSPHCRRVVQSELSPKVSCVINRKNTRSDYVNKHTNISTSPNFRNYPFTKEYLSSNIRHISLGKLNWKKKMSGHFLFRTKSEIFSSPAKVLSTSPQAANVKLLICNMSLPTGKLTKMALELGVEVVDDPIIATHVIAGDSNHSMRRTPKLMAAFCVTANILKADWLKESYRKKNLLNCNHFLLLNDSVAEDAYSFTMKNTLKEGYKRRNEGGLFSGWYILFCHGVAGNRAPKNVDLRMMVQCAGGTIITFSDIPLHKSDNPSHVLVITSTPQTKKQCENSKAMLASKEGAGFFTSSWLFDCMMHQKLKGIKQDFRYCT